MATPSRWLIPEADSREVAELARQASIAEAAARVLHSRGYRDAAAIRAFLHPTLDILPDPMGLLGMDRAAARLAKAITAGEPILLYGDYDVDGVCSVVILKKAIELAGGSVSYHVPDRIAEGYGMRADVIERLAAQGVKLIVSVDTGIRAIEAVGRAAELGVDVIVTDHHLPLDELPPAYAVVNPNQTGCPYPGKTLCGAGVTWKLVDALFGELDWPSERRRKVTVSLLKMVAVATVADVVPLLGENRAIVKHGLAGFRSVSNIGLRALLEVSGFHQGSCPTAGQVAFRLAPRINAAGRMASAADVVEMFLTADPAEARRVARMLHELNAERQQAEAHIIQQILAECERTSVQEGKSALVFCSEGWHRGVVGIVASRVVERFHRPTVVLSIDPEDGLARGSGRSIRPFHLLEALESMSDLFTAFGGHRQAAGVTLPAGRVEEFRERLNRHAGERLTDEDLIPVQRIDAPLSLGELDDRLAADILSMAPFGFGNPSALFAVLGAEVAGTPEVFKEKHVRFHLRQNGRTVSLKAWNFAERLEELVPGRRLDAAIAIEEDAYMAARGMPPWSLTLRDVRAASE